MRFYEAQAIAGTMREVGSRDTCRLLPEPGHQQLSLAPHMVRLLSQLCLGDHGAPALYPMGHTVLLGCQDSPASMGTVFWYVEGTWATSSKVDAFCRDKEKSRGSVLTLSQPGQLLPRDCDWHPQSSKHLHNTDLLPQSCTPQTHQGSAPLLQTHQRPCRHTLLHLEH